MALTFRAGEGEVFHMISHYYLQRAETRTRRHRMPAAAYAAEKGMAWDPATTARAADLTLGEVEAASSSARLFANVVSEKKRRAAGGDARRPLARGREPTGPPAPAESVTGERDGERQGGRMNRSDTVVTLLAAGLRCGEPQQSGPLTLVPLFHDGAAVAYRLFAEALAEGLVTVEEVERRVGAGAGGGQPRCRGGAAPRGGGAGRPAPDPHAQHHRARPGARRPWSSRSPASRQHRWGAARPMAREEFHASPRVRSGQERRECRSGAP